MKQASEDGEMVFGPSNRSYGWPALVGEEAWPGFAKQAMTDVRLNMALQIGNQIFEYIDAIANALGALEEYQQGAENVPVMSSPRMEAELKDRLIGAANALVAAMDKGN